MADIERTNHGPEHAVGNLHRVGDTLAASGFIVNNGEAVPADATAGYPKGMMWIDQSGGVGSTLFVNEGTLASCDFNAK